MNAHSEIADYYVTCRFCNRQTGTKKYLQPLIDLLLDAGGPDPDIEYERSVEVSIAKRLVSEWESMRKIKQTPVAIN